MRALKWVTALAVLATAVWCGYWFVGARALDRVIDQGLAHLPEVSVQDHHIQGFPNRFDVTFDAPHIRVDGAEWQAPFVQLFALSYRLNHVIAVFAHDQLLLAGDTGAALHSEDLRASLLMEPGLDLPLDAVTLVGQQLDLSVDGGTTGIDRLRLASRRIDDRVHQLVALAEGVFPDPRAMDSLDPQRLWPRRFDVLRLDAEAEFDRVLDRHLFDGPEPQLARLTLTGLHATWEGVDIDIAGRLTPGRDGALSGDVSAVVSGWRRLLVLLRDSGVLTPDLHDGLEHALAAMAAGQDGQSLEVPLSVVDGEVRLGPLWLGTLPAVVPAI
ncbi:MAG: DUF2125 domain-containing protein [Rhodobacteraceae bacterium]|nr:DUF2125 domain-containing protein [Paracoccaceae bacterium]